MFDNTMSSAEFRQAPVYLLTIFNATLQFHLVFVFQSRCIYFSRSVYATFGACFTHTRARAHACTHTHIHTHTRARARAHARTHTHKHAHTKHTHTHTKHTQSTHTHKAHT